MTTEWRVVLAGLRLGDRPDGERHSRGGEGAAARSDGPTPPPSAPRAQQLRWILPWPRQAPDSPLSRRYAPGSEPPQYLGASLRSRSRSATIRHHALHERAENYLAQGKKAMARKDLERILADDSSYQGVREKLAEPSAGPLELSSVTVLTSSRLPNSLPVKRSEDAESPRRRDVMRVERQLAGAPTPPRTPALSAVCTTQALGAGWRLTFRHDTQARANASASWSSASSRSRVLAAAALRHGSQLARKNSANPESS